MLLARGVRGGTGWGSAMLKDRWTYRCRAIGEFIFFLVLGRSGTHCRRVLLRVVWSWPMSVLSGDRRYLRQVKRRQRRLAVGLAVAGWTCQALSSLVGAWSWNLNWQGVTHNSAWSVHLHFFTCSLGAGSKLAVQCLERLVGDYHLLWFLSRCWLNLRRLDHSSLPRWVGWILWGC